MFTHLNYGKTLKKLETETINGKRYYITPEGTKCPSVTSVLSILSEDAIKKWREKVGEGVANEIQNRSTGSGEALHKVAEDYLQNKEITEKRLLPKAHFYNIKDYIDKINNIYAQEATLYSNELKLAGRVDCIAEYNGVLSVIDFKTTKKEKKEEWILGYFLQGTAYSLMFQERLGIEAEQVVILISGEDGSKQEWRENRRNFVDKLKDTIKLYEQKYQNT